MVGTMAEIDDSVKKKVPELRFKGFTDDWEERKLGEVGNTFTGLSGKTKEDFGHGEGKFITYMNVFSNPVADLDGLESVEIDNKQFQVKAGDVLFTTSSETPEEVGMSSMWLGNADNIYLNSFCFGYRPTIEFDKYYLAFMLRSAPIRKKFQLLAQGISRYNISKNKVMEMSIPVPSIEEQELLGAFFNNLNQTIALHQRKLDLLKEQKKGFLQKMFPKNGAKVPELRFAGFADDWEERKLGDHAKYRRGSFPQPYGNKEWYDGEGAMPFVQVVDVTNKLTLVENTKQKISKLAQSKSVFVPKGKVVVTLQGSIGRVAITQYDSFVDRTLLIFEDYEKETDERFWAYTIQKKFEIEKIKAPGGTIKTITKEALSSFDVHLPKFEEQQKIGSFFKQLDDIIALHQRKLDLLKEQKKGFLQKMFPKNGAKIPELRFAGFADDWEQRKLGDLSQDTIGGGTPKTSVTEYWNGEIPWIQSSDLANDKLYGVLPKKFITEDAVKNSATKLIPANSIAIVTRVGVGKLAFMPYEFASSQDFLSLSNLKVDCNFGMYSIYKMLQRELNNIQGTSIKGITKADLLDKEIFVPIKVEEQRKIGSFLKQLDGTIALHQRKLHLLKEQKKGFLQNMFV